MPYSNKLIVERKAANQAAVHLRQVIRKTGESPMTPMLSQALDKLRDALDVLQAVVDYDDDGTVLGLAGRYEGLQQPAYQVSWVIDAEAENPRAAAFDTAREYFRDDIAAGIADTACVFLVTDRATGVTTTIDLADCGEC